MQLPESLCENKHFWKLIRIIDALINFASCTEPEISARAEVSEMHVCVCSCVALLLLARLGSCWLLWLLLALPGSSWLFLLPGFSWFLLALSPWFPLAPPWSLLALSRVCVWVFVCVLHQETRKFSCCGQCCQSLPLLCCQGRLANLITITVKFGVLRSF